MENTITYNEVPYIHDYLDIYGHAILSAFKSGGSTTETALAKMRKYYGHEPVNKWIVRHHIVTKTPITIQNNRVRRIPYYA